MDDDEIEIIEINAGLTKEQATALRKALYELFGLPPDTDKTSHLPARVPVEGEVKDDGK